MVKLRYVLQKENICRVDGDTFFLVDRRIFPPAKTFAACSCVEDMANALRQMVAQGGDLHMEMREGKEVLNCMGHLVTEETIPVLYPSSDSIAPSLVTGIITPKGIFAPDALAGAYL